MQFLMKGDGTTGMSMHLVDATGRSLCRRQFNQKAWRIHELQAPTGHICAHCRHIHAIATAESSSSNQRSRSSHHSKARIARADDPPDQASLQQEANRTTRRYVPYTPFDPGEPVIWLSHILGTSGAEVVEGRHVTIIQVRVVRSGPRRVQVQVSSATGSRLVWVNPANLRCVDDPVVLEILQARGK